jgi:predicted SAM-dependent methyltransferase
MLKYLQYGCGLSNPIGWENYDSSTTLRIQRTPIIGKIMKSSLNVVFPKNIKYGDIVNGLNVSKNTYDGIYCSHVLEHLSYLDLKKTLHNTYEYLKPGGIFRMVLPDLEILCREYVNEVNKKNPKSSLRFMNDSLLGVTERKRGLKQIIINMLGNSKHLWMWDYYSLSEELREVGFSDIRRCKFNDSNDEMFLRVEEKDRFRNCLSIEVIK